MAKDNTTLILVVAGVGAAGVYYTMKKQSEVQAATAIAASQGIDVSEPPSFLDVLAGKVEGEITAFLEKGKELDALIKSRGSSHYAEWKLAIKKGRRFYVVKNPNGVAECFSAGTGAKVALKNCPSHIVAGAELEGYF